MTTPPHPLNPILLVDDEASWLRSMSLTLESEGGLNNLRTCQDGTRVMAMLGEEDYSLVLLDLTMPGVSGKELLQSIREAYPDLPVIIVSGRNQLETAVCCMRAGAQDYFVKGAEIDRLLASIDRLIEISNLQAENARLRQSMQQLQLKNPDAFAEIVTVSPKMQALFRYVEAIAAGQAPVLIAGESGVGKELLAMALHNVACPRGPWVPVNAAGLDDENFMSTLFGRQGEGTRKRGLVERARGGTLFLDEIGELGEQSQRALLRFAQGGEYLQVGSDIPWRSDARLVCATNRDLQGLVEEGRFRRDLYLRLRSHLVQVPPLRERKEDLPPLLQLFLEEAAHTLNKPVPTPPPELYLLLAAYEFPGNVWELRSLVFDAVAAHTSRILSMATFRKAMNLSVEVASDPVSANADEQPLLQFPGRLPTLAEAARLLVAEAMRRAGNNQSIAASFLGITRQALNQRLKKIADGTGE